MHPARRARIMHFKVDDVRIREIKELAPPAHLLREFPCTEKTESLAYHTREAIHRILHGSDDRVLVIIGPCSIHDPKAGLEYANRLQEMKRELEQDLLVVMRVYFEKPRTTVGWKGLVNDPDLASWGAIGARTTESQVHRELASGLSCPVGFKNGTDGNVRIAVDALKAARAPHHFLSVTKAGHSAIVSTNGNEDCHIILRGGKHPNYDAASVDTAARELAGAGLEQRLMVDCSHSNSQKMYQRQIDVAREVARQVATGDDRIFGVMIESNLKAGRQDLVPGKALVYGQSITDACIAWEDSVPVLRNLAEAVRKRRLVKSGDS